jgi:hypothetical protein
MNLLPRSKTHRLARCTLTRMRLTAYIYTILNRINMKFDYTKAISAQIAHFFILCVVTGCQSYFRAAIVPVVESFFHPWASLSPLCVQLFPGS